jgi:hypothetical protein
MKAQSGIVLLTVVLGFVGCSDSPTEPPPPSAQGRPVISSIAPRGGPQEGNTSVSIAGSGFRAGAIVTVGGAQARVTSIASTSISAITPPTQEAGAVDVVVTNPGGESATLAGGYTYNETPALSVSAISPDAGSTRGLTPVTITGSGFQSGVSVTFDGIRSHFQPWFQDSTRITAWSPPHAAGAVDVVVTNPDARTDRVTGGYTYAPPESFDLNGAWDGAAGPESWENPLRFTIHNNSVVGMTCGGSVVATFSPPLSITNGEFSFAGTDGVSMSGQFLTATMAAGRITFPSCSGGWFAVKQGTPATAVPGRK